MHVGRPKANGILDIADVLLVFMAAPLHLHVAGIIRTRDVGTIITLEKGTASQFGKHLGKAAGTIDVPTTFQVVPQFSKGCNILTAAALGLLDFELVNIIDIITSKNIVDISLTPSVILLQFDSIHIGRPLLITRG